MSDILLLEVLRVWPCLGNKPHTGFSLNKAFKIDLHAPFETGHNFILYEWTESSKYAKVSVLLKKSRSAVWAS